MNKKFNNMSTISEAITPESLADYILKKKLPYSDNVLPNYKNQPPSRVFMFSQKQGFRHSSPSYHERFVLVFMLRGSGKVLLDGRMLDMPRGEAMLIFPYQFHHFVETSAAGLSWLLITFESDDADYLLPLQNRCIKIPPACLREISLILPDFRNTKMPGKIKAPIISARLQIILYSLLSNISPKTPKPQIKSFSPDQPMYDVIRKVADKVSKNLERNYTVLDAAEDAGLSVSYLQKIFHKVLNIGVGTYIRRHKIFHATRLLKSTNMTISEISQKCGFDSLYTFSRTFKTIMKSSPRSFRNNTIPNAINAYLE